MSYTPGPWEVEKFICYMDRSDAAHWRKNGKPNAKVGDELWWVARSIGPVSISNNHWAGDYLNLSSEDICLISAAPDLLEALKLARRICNNLIGHPDDPYGKLIDAAIKKAEGG